MTADARAGAHDRRTARALLAAWWPNLAIWAALLTLLFLSLWLAYVPLGAWNFPVGLAIAAVKAGLVGFFFMSLRRAPALVRLALLGAGLFVAVMFSFTFNDLFTRL